MQVDIFVRTYAKDLNWLEHALRSIQKHVTGYRQIIVAIPNAKLLSHLTAERVIQVEDLPDGYIGQQLTKMEAWKYTDADAVVFWDSDVIATEPVDVSEWFVDGQPLVWKTRYVSINAPWQKMTEKAVGFPVEWEYMRRMPLVYRTDTLRRCCEFMEQLHGKPIKSYLKLVPHREFSEFNVLGAYAEMYEEDDYAFIDTETVTMPKNKLRQFWSWGGVTNEVLSEINSYL